MLMGLDWKGRDKDEVVNFIMVYSIRGNCNENDRCFGIVPISNVQSSFWLYLSLLSLLFHSSITSERKRK